MRAGDSLLLLVFLAFEATTNLPNRHGHCSCPAISLKTDNASLRQDIMLASRRRHGHWP